MKRVISLISVILILITMSLFLTGCLSALLVSSLKDNNEPSLESQPVTEDYTETYNTEVENAILADIPDVPFAGKPSESVSQGENIAEMIYQRAHYDVVSATNYDCTVLVTAPDMQVIYWDAFEQATQNYNGADAAASAEMETVLLNIIYTQLESGNYPQRQTTLTLELVNGHPQFTYEFADAMYGGMLTVWEQMTASYEEG